MRWPACSIYTFQTTIQFGCIYYITASPHHIVNTQINRSQLKIKCINDIFPCLVSTDAWKCWLFCSSFLLLAGITIANVPALNQLDEINPFQFPILFIHHTFFIYSSFFFLQECNVRLKNSTCQFYFSFKHLSKVVHSQMNNSTL